MLDLSPRFNQSSVLGITLLDFVLWAQESALYPKQEGALALPPVQRSVLWKPRQITDLWDSILSGLPIGSFYLVHRGAEQHRDVRPLAGGNTFQAETTGYNLLDGQQRARAMLLACRPPQEERRCLWIEFGNEAGAAPFKLHLTTAGQPFGYDHTSGDKLPLYQRRDARKNFASTQDWKKKPPCSIFDHQLFDWLIDQKKAADPNTSDHLPPKPYRANGATFALQDLFGLWQAAKSDSVFEADIRRKVAGGSALEISTQSIEALSAAFGRLREVELALILVRPELFKQNDRGTNLMLSLFDRIGAGGTPLSMEERLYSIYKFYVPRVHDTIQSIGADKTVGRFLPATKIAAAAIRVAAINIKPDWARDGMISVPDLSLFATYVRKTEKPFRKELDELLPDSSQSAGDKSLLTIFQKLMILLVYDVETNPTGLPRVMLPELPAELIQVLVLWTAICLRAGSDATSSFDDMSRAELLRFVMFWHLCCNNQDKASKQAFRFLRNSAHAQESLRGFPGLALYCDLTGKDHNSASFALQLDRPKDWENLRSQPLDPIWRLSNQRFLDGGPRPLYERWWKSRGKFLFWLQRGYLSREFAGYDPAFDRDEDQPYDLDHVCARDIWMNSIYGSAGETVPRNIENNARDGRHILGDAIGNFWWVGSSINRGWNNAPIWEKLKDSEDNLMHRDAIKEAFNEGDLESWCEASVPVHGWTIKAREHFQVAVERRTVWLYSRFYNELEFDKWLDEDATKVGSE